MGWPPDAGSPDLPDGRRNVPSMRLCRAGLHDLDDPANVYRSPTGRRGDTSCLPCRRAYQRAYAARTGPRPDRLIRRRAYYKAHREEAIDKAAEWNRLHRRVYGPPKPRPTEEERRQRNRDKSKRYATAHPEEIRARNRAYREAHPEWARASIAEWRTNNREAMRIHKRRVRAKQSGVLRVPYEPAQIVALVARYGGLCAYCRARPFAHLDHIIPLARGGPDALPNLVPACARCNQAKGSKMLDEWFRESIPGRPGRAGRATRDRESGTGAEALPD
jgi:5-methylcytosine-specific restriction endonuclease McrA